ncbi:hypothetical protein DITRI_Ditri07aG0002700 [Diplodiscus trichospermus]
MDVASTSCNRARRKGCGRRKIDIKKIENQRQRWVCFSKRKKGLLKKAAHLSKLTGEEIGVIIISEQGRVYNSENADDILERYLSQENTNGDNDDDDDDDGDDDGKNWNGEGVGANGGFWWSQPLDIEKIKDGSLEQVEEYGEALLSLKKNVVARMEEMKGKHCLIDLNKAPDEQFS